MIQDFPLPFDEFDEDEEDYEFKNRRLNKYQRKELKAIEKFIFKRFDKVSLIDGNPYLYTCRLAHNEDEALDMICEAVVVVNRQMALARPVQWNVPSIFFHISQCDFREAIQRLVFDLFLEGVELFCMLENGSDFPFCQRLVDLR